MSDAGLLRAIEQMEAWLLEAEFPEGGILAAWNQEVRSALAGAEKGPGWTDLVARARALRLRVETRAQALAVEREQIRIELEEQGRGERALKGYGAAAQ